jgi:23S rRNA (uridine2552-2'-O)-methyltransferase
MDQENIMDLAYSVFNFAQRVSAPNASLVIKVWSNNQLAGFMEKLKEKYEFGRYVKPDSSRAESAELYVLAKNFKKT